MSGGLDSPEAVVERALARCRDAIDDAIDAAGADDDRAALITLGLVSAVAGQCQERLTGAAGRTALSALAAADPDELLWALEAIASLDLEALTDATGATLVLRRRLS